MYIMLNSSLFELPELVLGCDRAWDVTEETNSVDYRETLAVFLGSIAGRRRF